MENIKINEDEWWQMSLDWGDLMVEFCMSPGKLEFVMGLHDENVSVEF